MARLVCAVFALLVLASMPARADGPTQMYYAPTGAPPFQPWAGTATTTPAATTHVQSGALASDLVVKNAAAHLGSFEVSADATLSAAAWWILVFDAASAPVDGAVTPAKCFALPLGTTSAGYGFSAPPAFLTGITISISTTGCYTKTASAHAFIAGDWQ